MSGSFIFEETCENLRREILNLHEELREARAIACALYFSALILSDHLESREDTGLVGQEITDRSPPISKFP